MLDYKEDLIVIRRLKLGLMSYYTILINNKKISNINKNILYDKENIRSIELTN